MSFRQTHSLFLTENSNFSSSVFQVHNVDFHVFHGRPVGLSSFESFSKGDSVA